MAFQLFVAPHRFEDLDQIRGRNDLDTEAPHQFDRAGIHARNVRDRVQRRILHRDFFYSAKRLSQTLMQLLPGQIDPFVTRQTIQRTRLYRMNNLLGCTRCWNKVKPTPCRKLSMIQSQNIFCDRIASSEAIEQPPVELVLLQGFLQGRDMCFVYHCPIICG